MIRLPVPTGACCHIARLGFARFPPAVTHALHGGGSYDWLWLFDPKGKEIGPVGEDATNFMEVYCPEEEKKE